MLQFWRDGPLVRRILLAGMLVALGVTAVRGHPPAIVNQAGERAIAGEIEAFRAALAAAIARKDAARLREMYAPSFVYTHGSGKQDARDLHIAAVLAGDPNIETAPVNDLVIRVPNDWTAIATGTSPLRSIDDGKSYDVRWIVVYVRTDQSWAVAASQATRLGEARR